MEEIKGKYGGHLYNSALLKIRLYEEQYGKCGYSLNPLDYNRVVSDSGYVEIDHVLPYSLTFDDNFNNKILVLSAENRNKGNKITCDYLGGDSEKWNVFKAAVNANKNFSVAKKHRLLCTELTDEDMEGFKERNLNDTRYICRFFKKYIERFLLFADGSQNNINRCLVVSGAMTATMRRYWGIKKDWSENDRHHALDAAVIAACSRSLVQRVAKLSQKDELYKCDVDCQTGEVLDIKSARKKQRLEMQPWKNFAAEVQALAQINDVEALREKLVSLGFSDEEAHSVKPLFVSRAVQRLKWRGDS